MDNNFLILAIQKFNFNYQDILTYMIVYYHRTADTIAKYLYYWEPIPCPTS